MNAFNEMICSFNTAKERIREIKARQKNKRKIEGKSRTSCGFMFDVHVLESQGRKQKKGAKNYWRKHLLGIFQN
jgi:hypothetical protein